MINKMETMSKKGGIGKILVWIIIVLVVLGVIFMGYKYIVQDNGSGDDTGTTVSDDTTGGGDSTSQQDTGEEIDDEKPPRPPE